MSEEIKKHKMTKKEKEDWDKLYEYVRTNIMGYDKNQSLPREMTMRIKGLLTGKFFENKNIKNTANYSYEVILMTFKFCSLDIKNAISKNMFKDERHKMNYILKIVESNINTVYMRMKNAEKNKIDINSVDVKTDNIEKASEIQKKEKESHKNRYENLW